MACKVNSQVPVFEYTAAETEIWRSLYTAMTPLVEQVACEDYVLNFIEMQENQLLSPEHVPQLRDISKYLHSKTGFLLKPVASLTNARDFLSCLAFRVFPTRVHMRFQPYFSIDPDVAHEVIGHAPMLANAEFAEFMQEIGMASLGASDEDIHKLMNLYFYSVEHGLILTALGERKVYGARLLSSVDEVRHALSIRPELRHFDPFEACKHSYSRRHLQPVYWFASDFRETKATMKRFTQSLRKPFHAAFNRKTKTVVVDHRVKGIN